MDDTPSEGVGPFEFSFNFSDDHCSAGLTDWICDQLSPTQVQRFEALTGAEPSVEDAHKALTALLGDRENPTPPDDLTQLELAESIARECAHYRCNCASEAWSFEEDYANSELLGKLPKRRWAVYKNDAPDDELRDGELTMNALFAAITRSDGWCRTHLVWDGKQLTAAFGDDHGWWPKLRLLPLTELQERAAAFVDDYYVESPSHAALRWEDTLLAVVLPLYDRGEDGEDFPEAVAKAKALGAGALSPEAADVAGALADTWEGSLEDLLSTARLLVGDPAPVLPAEQLSFELVAA